jgi:hypothetical protein
MGILRSHRKVPIRWLQRDSEFPFEAFLLSANGIFLKLTNFLSIPNDKPKKEERNMYRSKIVGIMALIVFAMGILVVGNAVAGKEATEGLTSGWYGTFKTVTFGQDYIYAGFEAIGVFVGDTGNEMLHGASGRGVGEWQVEKGFFSQTGGCVYTLLSGDKIYLKFFDSAKSGETSKGTATILGGTGKCAGIEGSGEYTMHPSVPSVEGAVWQGLMKMKLHYKLP